MILTLKTPWRDGTSYLKFTPVEFLQRLADLVSRPRLHLTRFHGVLAPNARLRREVLPPAGADPEPGMQPPGRSARMVGYAAAPGVQRGSGALPGLWWRPDA